MLWVVNTTEKKVKTGLWLRPPALGIKSRDNMIVYNLESGVQLGRGLPRWIDDPRDKETLWGNIVIPPHDFLALMVEPGVYKDPYKMWP
jgi:hypothetical protein